MGSKAKAPADRNYGNEITQTFNAQLALEPQLLAAQQQYAPQYTALNTSLLGQALQGQIGNIQAAQPQYSALQQQEIASNPLMAALQATAMNDIQAGGSLTNEERLAVNEASRSKFAGRGTYGSNASALDQILSRGQYAQNRYQQRLANASGIANQLTGYTGGGLAQGLIGSYGSAVGGPQLINPESAAAQDVYNTNYNAAQARYINSKNNQAALMGGLIKGVGTVGLGLATGGLGFGAGSATKAASTGSSGLYSGISMLA